MNGLADQWAKAVGADFEESIARNLEEGAASNSRDYWSAMLATGGGAKQESEERARLSVRCQEIN